MVVMGSWKHEQWKRANGIGPRSAVCRACGQQFTPDHDTGRPTVLCPHCRGNDAEHPLKKCECGKCDTLTKYTYTRGHNSKVHPCIQKQAPYLVLLEPSLGPCDLLWSNPSNCKWAARQALETKLRRKLEHNEVVRHKCDVWRCRNPEHLEVGTSTDNNRDTVQRRRHVAIFTKLSGDLRREIAARYKFGGISQEKLAQEYGVTQSAVSAYVRGKWS